MRRKEFRKGRLIEYDDERHRKARERQRIYDNEIKEILHEHGWKWTPKNVKRAQDIRWDRKYTQVK